jgi:EAL domain-containing protein (putative c-di-GMP-specific phosphodiesterase class I)
MHKGRLLILDDDPAIGKTIELVAESVGFQARSVSQPDAFFRELDLWPPTHVAIDLIMPEMDGVEVVQLLADRGCRAGIIITSGIGSRVLDAARRSAVEHGLDVVGVLAKPFFAEAVRTLLQKSPSGMVAQAVVKGSAQSRQFKVTEGELQRALRQQEFRLDYQPKVECATGRVAGFEALVRWDHPSNGIVMPDDFVPLAEASGLIDPLTLQILDRALRWLSRIVSAPERCLSVNLSAKSLVDHRFADRIANLCRKCKIDPARLILEVTETSAMQDPIAALDLLTRFRMKGFQLSIDDFGTGYSSMRQLVRLPFSEMKVDRSFVMAAAQSQESRAVIRSVVDLGHSLGLSVCAEGVEDSLTLEYLNDIGCDLAQGYFIARPMASDAIADWCAKWESGEARHGGARSRPN